MVGNQSKLTEAQWDEVRKMDKEGIPRSEICRILFRDYAIRISRARMNKVLGPKGGRPGEVTTQVKVEISHEELDHIREIAAEMGFRSINGILAGQGSISGLIRAIGRGEVKVSPGKKARK